MRIYEITNAIEQYAPKELAASFDNVGLMLGDKNRDVSTVLLTLDVDLGVAMEAKAMGAELIISHHPLIFNPLYNIESDSITISLFDVFAFRSFSFISASRACCSTSIFFISLIYVLHS